MQSFYAYYTDIGIKKKTNQDSLLIKEAETEQGKILFMVICDGMGGLAKGEVASASLITAFGEWFEEKLPYVITEENGKTKIQKQWDEIIQRMNEKITAYGACRGIQLGTTVTAMLFLEDGAYLIGHVGDTRAYHISNQNVEILTTDQTFVAREIREGRMTEEEAKADSRRNMLLQCVGASPTVEVEFLEGNVKAGDVYMLCCDGFRHMVSSEEMRVTISPKVCQDAEVAKKQLLYLTETNKQRGETDNITALLAKVW